MQLMFFFFHAHPGKTLVMLLALLFSGFAEGIGLFTLLPLLNMVTRNEAVNTTEIPAQQNAYEHLVIELLNEAGITPGTGTMLSIIVIAVTLKNLLLLLANKQVGYTAAYVATDLRLEMLRAILQSRWEYFISKPVGTITNALATEANRSSQAFISGALMITFALQTVVYASVAFALSWKATLVSLVTGLFIITVANSLVHKARKAGSKQTRLMSLLIAHLTDALQSVKPLKAMARENEINGVLNINTSRLNRTLQRQVISTAALGAVQEVLLVGVIAAGMFIALVRFEMPFTTVLVLVAVLGRMLRQFSKVQREYQKMVIGEGAFRSLRDTIDQALEAGETPGAGRHPSLENGIRVVDVHFSYSGHAVLDGLTVTIPAGSLTTLTGPSGAGKTTLIDLITGLLKPRSGTILIDNIPMPELDMKAWRNMIGYVPQETQLLHKSILHNVTLGNPELGYADAERALKDAGAWEFVTTMPEGMESIVGERGLKLSGGQRQRILIARALVNQPRLLILDEPTSALDPASEAAILETIGKLRGKLTLLAISHQTALVDAADFIYRLENGRIDTGVTPGTLPGPSYLLVR